MRGDITFIKGQGASKRTAAGEDFISGLILYTGTLPSGFTTTVNIKQMFSIVDAENAGILSDYSDETKAAGAVAVTHIGANADTFNIKISEPLGTVDLGTYTQVSGDTTPNKVGDAIAAIINAGTKTHGYVAVNGTGTITITARPGLGIFLNTTSPVATFSGSTFTNTVTAFSAGVASKQAVWHYHIAEYFRGNPNSSLWVGFFPVPNGGIYTFGEITLLQTAASGKIRQVGIFKDSAAYASGDLTAIDGIIKTYNDARHKPLSALYAADLKAMTDITTCADLTTLSANKVSSIIGQDGAALGAYLYAVTGKSVSQLGIALGMLSLSAVSEDFGNPAKFNISNGTENDIPAFANGQLLSDPLLSDAALDAIDAKRHIFGQKYGGYAGTYFNDNHTAIIQTSDYAFINDNRVIDKAIRGIYTALIPYLKSNLLKNSDGTLAATTVAFLEAQALAPLYQMAREQDLGTVVKEDVYIDPTQNVTTTSLLIVNVQLNENGIARNIQVPISFK